MQKRMGSPFSNVDRQLRSFPSPVCMGWARNLWVVRLTTSFRPSCGFLGRLLFLRKCPELFFMKSWFRESKTSNEHPKQMQLTIHQNISLGGRGLMRWSGTIEKSALRPWFACFVSSLVTH